MPLKASLICRMVISKLYGRYVHLPLDLVTLRRKKLNITSDYWRSVLESTGQHVVTPFTREPVLYCAGEVV